MFVKLLLSGGEFAALLQPGPGKDSMPLHRSNIGIGPDSGKIRAVILDLDGTLIGPDERITPVVKDAVGRLARRLPVAIATGREAFDAARYALELGLASPQICDGGATILDPATGEHIWRRPLKPESAQRVMARLQEIGASFIATHLKGSVRDHNQIPHWDLTRISALDLEEEAAAELAASLNSERDIQTVKVFLPYNGLWAVDFTLAGVDKAAGVLRVGRTLGVDPADMVAVGDSYNDLPMLEACGSSVAMGDAPPEVRAAADYVAPPVSEDGLAVAINEYVLPRLTA